MEKIRILFWNCANKKASENSKNQMIADLLYEGQTELNLDLIILAETNAETIESLRTKLPTTGVN